MFQLHSFRGLVNVRDIWAEEWPLWWWVHESISTLLKSLPRICPRSPRYFLKIRKQRKGAFHIYHEVLWTTHDLHVSIIILHRTIGWALLTGWGSGPLCGLILVELGEKPNGPMKDPRELIMMSIRWPVCPCYLRGRMGCDRYCVGLFPLRSWRERWIQKGRLPMCTALGDPGFTRGSWAERGSTEKLTPELSSGSSPSESLQRAPAVWHRVMWSLGENMQK